jgi:hypothetical protein
MRQVDVGSKNDFLVETESQLRCGGGSGGGNVAAIFSLASRGSSRPREAVFSIQERFLEGEGVPMRQGECPFGSWQTVACTPHRGAAERHSTPPSLVFDAGSSGCCSKCFFETSIRRSWTAQRQRFYFWCVDVAINLSIGFSIRLSLFVIFNRYF